MATLIVATMPSSAQSGIGVSTGGQATKAASQVPKPATQLPKKLVAPATPPGPTALHFHGNPDDVGTPGPCTGTATTDIAGCGGPFLKSNPTLFAGAAAHWDANSAVDGTADRNIYDPNWVWNLSGPATLRGDMIVNWWGTCGACSPGLFDAEWDLRLWADGTKVFEQHIIGPTPATPNVPSLLSATVNIPLNITANTTWVLQIDPTFADTQANTKIYYDSSLPCPGASGNAPCDSTVTMPVVDPNAAPTLSISDASATEGNSGTKTFTFTVSLSSPAPPAGVTFNIATQDDTATVADSDYVAKSLMAQTIASGGTSYTFNVTVNGDTKVEPHETFFVNVTNVSGATVTDGQGAGTILNDDSSNPSTAGLPRFFNYYSPQGVADDAGEPSIGVNWTTEQTFSNSMFSIPNGGTSNYFGGFLPYMLKVTFDDCPSPAKATWDQKPVVLPSTPRAFGDPILFTDHVPGRTFVSQLEGLTPAGSTTEYTDNDGDTFMPSQGSGEPSGIDHQTIGGGPFAPGLSSPVYPHAIYYCSQSVADAVCSLSVDGGQTFGPAVPMYTLAQCGGLHGHIKVAPDGTAYVPNKNCGGKAGLIVSENNGVTWTVRTIQQSTTDGQWDSAVAVAADGTVFYGYRDGNGRARTAVSRDKGQTWTDDQDVGAQLGLKKIAFPAMVAGDGGLNTGRSAFVFFGTTTDGLDSDPSFTGIWYLYVSTTFDGGKTWVTQNITPGDPVQRGGICNSGACRNLLDFFGADVDKEGRVLVGWEDGCIGGCVNGPPNSFTAKGVIARQTGGMRMFAAFDPVEPTLPGAPNVTGSINGAGTAINLSWPVPDNGGATITAYKVYRREGGAGAFNLIATVKETHYTDTTFNPLPAVEKAYRVTAVNDFNSDGMPDEGPYCHEFIPQVGSGETACVLPGIRVIHDFNQDGSDADSGQNTPPDGSVNVRDLFIAEPFLGAGVNQLIFRLEVAPSLLSSPPPNSQWFIVWNRLAPDTDFDRWYVAMRTDASGTPSFEYGKFGVALDPTNPNPNANTPVKLGDADSGSYDLATGVIIIKLSNSKAENAAAGQTLAGMNVRTYFNRPDPGPRSQNNASDITGDSSYTLAGNAACGNHAPTAALTASPQQGPAPLTVNFNGSGSSDPDQGDSIKTYIFSFGDGTPDVSQSTPTISHQYTQSGNFFATLRVEDQSNVQSLNVASVQIEVQDASAGVNYAVQSKGGQASASSTYSGRSYPASAANDGSNTGLNWEQGGGWNDGTRDLWPDWLQVDFNSAKTINEIRVYTLQDDFKSPQVPNANTTCGLYGLIDFDVQYWDGSQWVTVPGGAIRGNNHVITTITGLSLPPFTKFRVNVLNAREHFSRIVEVEAYGPAGQ